MNIKYIFKRLQDGMLSDILNETKWIYQYAKKYRLFLFAYTLLGLTNTFTTLLSSLVSRNLVDIITGGRTEELFKTFSLMIILAVFSILITQLSGYLSSWINFKVDTDMKADVFSKMLVTDWESITAYHTGDLLTRWSNDASNVASGLLNWIPNLVIYSVHFISAFLMILSQDASFAFFALLGLPFSALISRSLLTRMRSNNQKSAAMSAKMSGFHQEAFSNIQTIKAFDMIQVSIDHLKQLQKEYVSMKMEFQRMSAATSIFMSAIGLLVTYSSYGWGIYRVFSGAISYGTMTMFLSLSGTLTNTLNSLISLVPNAISITSSAGRLMDILDMPQEDYSREEEVRAFSDSHKEDGISLRISDIDYSYHNGTQVFKNASLEANPHEIIGLVGPSGEGKTTMLRLLLSLLRPQHGHICLFSGKNGDSIPLSPSARKLCSYVPQGNTMFSGTIAENMRNVKPDATEEEIREALHLACALEFVDRLPGGIHSQIGERGGGFSEGQAQRLSIARALLKKSPILLLDEATSALDVQTERLVLKNIMKSSYPRTCLVTTHRPTVLGLCKRVYAIQEKQCRLLDEKEIKRLMDDF